MPGIRQQNRRRRIGLSRFAPLLSGGAKAGAAAVFAAALFASSPYTNEAGAIDIRGSAVNASLAFPRPIWQNHMARPALRTPMLTFALGI